MNDRPTSISGTPRKVANRSTASTGFVAAESVGATPGATTPSTPPKTMAAMYNETWRVSHQVTIRCIRPA